MRFDTEVTKCFPKKYANSMVLKHHVHEDPYYTKKFNLIHTYTSKVKD
jgi:hypothetical protein